MYQPLKVGAAESIDEFLTLVSKYRTTVKSGVQTLSLFSDAPYIVWGVSIYQDVCMYACSVI